jgi:hypothetical protein
LLNWTEEQHADLIHQDRRSSACRGAPDPRSIGRDKVDPVSADGAADIVKDLVGKDPRCNPAG